MKIYFASGYTIMNVKGAEEKIIRMGVRNRLVSYNDCVNTKNNVMNTINVFSKRQNKKS